MIIQTITGHEGDSVTVIPSYASKIRKVNMGIARLNLARRHVEITKDSVEEELRRMGRGGVDSMPWSRVSA